jgi:hypothetical protein
MISFDLPDYAELQTVSHFTFLRSVLTGTTDRPSGKLGYKAIAIR